MNGMLGINLVFLLFPCGSMSSTVVSHGLPYIPAHFQPHIPNQHSTYLPQPTPPSKPNPVTLVQYPTDHQVINFKSASPFLDGNQIHGENKDALPRRFNGYDPYERESLIPKDYNFEYKVKDDYYGDDFSHSETKTGYITAGEYRV